MHILVAVSVLTGCAHQKAASPLSPGGRLNVENVTGEEVELFVEGDRVALLPDGGLVELERLPLGAVAVHAVGSLTGYRVSTDLDLGIERPEKWLINASKEHHTLLDGLPSGSLRVVNRSSEPVRVTIDGLPREVIQRGSEVVYSDIRFGEHRLSAKGIQTGFEVDTELSVSEGVIPEFLVASPRSAVKIYNGSGIALEVTVGDFTRVRLENGATRVVDGLEPGDIPVMAMDLAGRVVFSTMTPLKTGEVAPVDVPIPTGIVAVVSDLDELVTIFANGRLLGECEPGGAAEFKGLVPGIAHLQAMGSDGRLKARVRLDVPEDTQTVWMLKPGLASESIADEGALLVLNMREETIRIRVDGYDRGDILPAGRRLVTSLLPGRHVAEAIGKRTLELMRAELDIGIGEKVEWLASPSVATLALINVREEEVRVTVDGLEAALLAPSESLDIKVSNGRHHVLARGTSTMCSTDHDVDLPASTRTELKLTSPLGSLKVTNSFGEPLSISSGDRDLGVVLPGDLVVFRDIDPGKRRLEAKSLTRPLSWAVVVTLRPGETYDWELSN